MAWIRRVRTPSGATAVQIAESVEGRRRIVKHVGSAHDDAQLGVLVAQAEALLADPGQGELELGLEPTPRKVDLVPEPARQSLLAKDVEPERTVRVSTPRVTATSSRLLYDVLISLYTDLGFDVVGDATFLSPTAHNSRGPRAHPE